jgi:hypothetical protein
LDNEIKNVIVDLDDGPLGLEVLIRPYPGIPNGTCLQFG